LWIFLLSQDRDPRARELLAAGLDHRHDDESVQVLLGLFLDDRLAVRQAASIALSRMQPQALDPQAPAAERQQAVAEFRGRRR
jgi:hypothetical protein